MLGKHLNKHYKQTERSGDEDHRSKRRKSVEKAPARFLNFLIKNPVAELCTDKLLNVAVGGLNNHCTR